MNRLFWLSQLVFTGWGLTFFISLHLSNMFLWRFSNALAFGGMIVFGLGFVPMWLVVVFSISRGKWKDRKNWMEEMIAECPYSHLVKKWFKVLGTYCFILLFLGIVVPDSMGRWAGYLRSVGLPCILIIFYGIGFLCAWANWRKCDGHRPPLN